MRSYLQRKREGGKERERERERGKEGEREEKELISCSRPTELRQFNKLGDSVQYSIKTLNKETSARNAIRFPSVNTTVYVLDPKHVLPSMVWNVCGYLAIIHQLLLFQ
jgi:hypothetical protein